jgi:hypothetical protein
MTNLDQNLLAAQPTAEKQQSEKIRNDNDGLRPTRQPKDHAFFRIPQRTDSKILNVLIQMKKDNKSDYTINFARKALTFLNKHTSLAEPEAVKMLIAEHKSSDGYKRNLCIAYNKYAKFYNITWNMPKYREPAKNIALPTKEKIQMLIARAGQLLSMKLSARAWRWWKSHCRASDRGLSIELLQSLQIHYRWCSNHTAELSYSREDIKRHETLANGYFSE